MITEFRHLAGTIGTVRTAPHQGREHLVVPVVALIGNSVIHAVNAPTAELVPLATLEDGTERWNDKPICLGHPVRGGRQCSANDPEIMASYAFGHIREAQIKDGKLSCEAWLDPDRLMSLGATATLDKLRAGQMMDVSVGAFVRTTDESGDWYGKKYHAKWAQIVPDHLAFLPHTSGACSIKMGCGANRAAEGNMNWKDKILATLAGLVEDVKKASEPEVLEEAGHEFHGNQYTDGGGGGAAAKPESRAVGKIASGDTIHDATGAPLLKVESVVNARQSGYKIAIGTLQKNHSEYGKQGSKVQYALGHKSREVMVSRSAEDGEPATLEKSLDDRIMDVMRAVSKKFNSMEGLVSPANAFAHRVFEDHVVVAKGDKYFDCSYTVEDDGEIELGEPAEVKLEFVAAAGARNSASDQKRIQTMHDYSVELGATCSAQNIKALEEPVSEVEIVNAEPAHDGGKEEAMDPKKAALIKALTECPCSGFTTDDVKTLEAFSEERLTALAAVGKARKATEDELTAATERIATIEGELKAAQAAIIPADELAALKTLAAEKATADEAHKATIVTALKTAQSEYTEDELKAMDIKSLERLSKVVKIPDFSGRGMPRAAEESGHKYAPPDAYADGLKALAVKSN